MPLTKDCDTQVETEEKSRGWLTVAWPFENDCEFTDVIIDQLHLPVRHHELH